MTSQSIPTKLLRIILETETSSQRFEHFCNDLFSDVDEREYVPTSPTWDLGRNGRAVSEQGHGDPAFICATLRSDLEAKIGEDLQRILMSASPRTLIVCSHQDLSEKRCDELTCLARGQMSQDTDVRVVGLLQIIALVSRHPGPFRKHYATDLQQIRDALTVTGEQGEEAQITGMRIALTTQLHDDAQKLRGEIARNLVLTSLAKGDALNDALIIKHISDALHLGRVIQPEYVHASLEQLVATGHVSECDGAYSLAGSGRDELDERTTEGSKRLIEGKRFVRDTLQELLGFEFTDADFNLLWKTVQDGIANMFFSHGIGIIEAISSIVTLQPFAMLVSGNGGSCPVVR